MERRTQSGKEQGHHNTEHDLIARLPWNPRVLKGHDLRPSRDDLAPRVAGKEDRLPEDCRSIWKMTENSKIPGQQEQEAEGQANYDS